MKLGGIWYLIVPWPKLGKLFKGRGQTNLNEFAAYLCLFIEICLLSTVFKEIFKEVKYMKKRLIFHHHFLHRARYYFTGGGVCGCLFCVPGAFHVLDNGV